MPGEKRIPLTNLVADTLREILEDKGLTASAAIRRLGVTPARLNGILKKGRPIDAEMAMRIARLFGTTPNYWLNMQIDRQLRELSATKGKQIEREVQPL